MHTEQFEKINLLLVDDEDNFRGTLVKRLNKRGITARQAQGGEACLAMLADHPMDVVVLDVKMPGISGIEVLHRIKAGHPQTEVILLTGHTDTADGIEGIKSGAFDYLSKPIAFEHLLGKISQAYEKKLRAEERKREAEYKARIEQQMIATERLAALGTLAAGVAHEINNPLAIINEAAGFMELLLKKPETARMPRRDDFEKALDKIHKGVMRARAITHQLLGSVGKHEPVLAQIDPVSLIDETIRLVRKDASFKNITISTNIARTVDTLWLDPNPLRQILINLLTNAIHATGPDGAITIGLDRTAEGIVLTVRDTGKGIPKENLEKIFEPFFSDKPPGEGTGLGLFVTREIVDKLGGAIQVQSRVGAGTTMIIRIPPQRIEPQ